MNPASVAFKKNLMLLMLGHRAAYRRGSKTLYALF